MGISLLQVSCAVFGIRRQETPRYEVITDVGDKEVRAYSAYIVAKTTVKGDFNEAQGAAFRILAGYLFGANEKKQALSLAAPGLQSKSAESEKLAMTAPVVQSQLENGWVMAFMMPSKYKLAELPTPKDERILFEEIPSKIVGVIRYSGRGHQTINAEMAQELRAWIVSEKKYEIVAGPSYAGFDPPWAIPFFRRNEMMYDLRAKN